MPLRNAKDNMYVKQGCSLTHAYYHLSLGGGLYVGAYREKLIIGPVESPEEQPQFSKNSVVVPSSSFYSFSTAVSRGRQSFEREDPAVWEKEIYAHSPHQKLFAIYETWQGEQFLKLSYKWYFKKDKVFQHMCAHGERDPIDESTLPEGQDFKFLKRFVALPLEAVELLDMQMPTLLEFSLYGNTASKAKLLNLIEYATSSEESRARLRKDLRPFDQMTNRARVVFLQKLLKRMFEEKKLKNDDHQQKSYLDEMVSKINLIFPLLQHQLDKKRSSDE